MSDPEERKLPETPQQAAWAIANAITREVFDHSPDESIRALEAAVDMHPVDVHLRRKLGFCLFSRGRFEEALRHLDQAYQRNPEDVMLCQNLGVCHLELGQPTQALHYLEQAVALEPRPETQLYLGRCYLIIDRAEDAQRTLARVIEHSPDNIAANYYVGVALLSLQDEEGGVRHVLRALELEPDHAAAMRTLSTYYLEAEDYDQAKIWAKRFAALAARTEDRPGVDAALSLIHSIQQRAAGGDNEGFDYLPD